MTDSAETQRTEPGVQKRRRALRRQFRRARRSLTRLEQRLHAEAAARLFFARGLHLAGRTIGLYLASDGELDTAPLIVRLRQTRHRLALPVVGRDGRMEFRAFAADTPLQPNRFGILEPGDGAPRVALLAMDVLLMPLVAFDDAGNRLGMGAGYYDRFLGRLPAPLRPRLIGLAHELQRAAAGLPPAPWDVPLDGVLTERGYRSPGSGRRAADG